MVKALSARVFIRVFEVCRSLVLIPPNGGSRSHRPVCIYSPYIASRFPFCLWLCSFRFCDSAAHLLVCRAPFPSSAVQKSLGNGRNVVVGLHLKLPFTPDFPVGWDSFIGDLWQIAPNRFWALQQTDFSCNKHSAFWARCGLLCFGTSPDHVTCLPLGLLQMVLVDCLWRERKERETVKKLPHRRFPSLLPMASSSSHPPPDTAKASGDDSEIPTADAGTMDTGSVGDESVDGSRFSPVPEDDRDDFAFPLPGPLRGDMQPVPIDFEFPCSAAADWFHWVADEFMDVEFCALLERAGVAEAILLSRSCNMYRDTEALRQILRRWCTSTHTFFFSWGELTITLEDVENHWLLPVLGDMDPFAVEMSEEETVVEQALMARASTRINAWSVYFAKATEPTIRRAAFVAYWLCKCLFGDAPYYSMKPLYFRLAVKISFGHRFPLAAMFLGYLYLQLDSVCLDEIRGGSCHFITTCFNTSALQTFLWERSLNYQEAGNDNSQIRAKFKNMSRQILRSDIASQSFELSPDDTRSLTYSVCGESGVRRQFGLDQGVPGSPSETLPRTPNIAPFLNDHAFDYWSPSVSRMVIPCGGRLGICTVAMQEYWLRVAAAMADYVKTRQRDQGRAWDSQNGMVHEMGGSCIALRSLPSWKESVKVVEERLRLDSKRGKGSKKIDSGKGASSPAASKQKPKSAAKASSKRPKVAMDMSMIPPSELGDRALMAPGTSKKKKSAAGASKRNLPLLPTKAKSQPRSKSVAVKKAKSKPTRKSAVAPPSSSEEPAAESATPVEKESAVPTPPSTIYDRTRSKRKAVEEQVRSQAKRKIGDEGEGSDQAPIEVSGGDDVVDAGVGAAEVSESIVERQEVGLKSTDDVAAKDSPIDWTDSDDAMADEALGVTVSDEAVLVMADEAVRSTTEEASGEIPVVTADVVPEAHEITRVMADETLVDVAHETAPVTADETLAGSAAEEDYDQGTDSVDSEETIADEPQPLQIIPFADQPEEPRAIDPIEILREEGSPMVVIDHPSSGTFTGGQVPALEGIPIQDADDRGMADTEVRGVDVVPEDVEDACSYGEGEHCSCSICGSQFLSDTVCSRGPLVAYGNFWVYQDAVPLLQGLSAKFGDFTTHFKFGAGFGGPMLSLLGSVLADMRRTSFKTLSEPKILSWRSVVQDLIAVGFDLDFMLEHLRKVARKFFGEAIASEMKIVQEQISSLQSTLAVLAFLSRGVDVCCCSIPRSC
uniref:Aminotransferase-like plant mobile domain-containing protein n=1 Tax=Fagus sylvatica TaxID=28930 RepID=A0A2N9HJ25_FAGSY